METDHRPTSSCFIPAEALDAIDRQAQIVLDSYIAHGFSAVVRDPVRLSGDYPPPPADPHRRHHWWPRPSSGRSLRGLGAPPREDFRGTGRAVGVLETLLQKPYADIVAERIFQPLGMTQSYGAITSSIQPTMARGYAPLHDDRPWQRMHGIVPATWLETGTGDG